MNDYVVELYLIVSVRQSASYFPLSSLANLLFDNFPFLIRLNKTKGFAL